MEDPLFAHEFEANVNVLPLREYLQGWASEPRFNRNAAGRIVEAIGKPCVVDTSKDMRLNRIFCGRTIHYYKPFERLVGIEESLHSVVQYFNNAAKGLEQWRQILAILGPVGSGKSTLMDTLVTCAQAEPVYVLCVTGEKGEIELSPVLENPLGLFQRGAHGAQLQEAYNITPDRLEAPMSPWAARHLNRLKNRASFSVAEVRPSSVAQLCVARVEPGGKNADVGALIGKIGNSHTFDDYHYTGGLNRTSQGLLEFFEMFKSHPTMLEPLLAATQDRRYAGAGGVGVLPYQGCIVAHFNEKDWIEFKEKGKSEALADRICAVEIPYCIRTTEEAELYRQYLGTSDYRDIPIATGSLEMIARFAIGTRVDTHTGNGEIRIRVYDGRQANGSSTKSADMLREESKWREGMAGIPTRLIFKVLPEIIQWDPVEKGLDPVNVLEALKRICVRERLPEFNGKRPDDIVSRDLQRMCTELVAEAVERAFVGDHQQLLRYKFGEYVDMADAWCEERSFTRPGSVEVMNQSELDEQLAILEKGIANNDRAAFRSKIVFDVMKFMGNPESQGKPPWTPLHEDVWHTFEKNILPTRETILPIVSYDKKKTEKLQKEHDEFVTRFCAHGYTARQVRRMVESYQRIGI